MGRRRIGISRERIDPGVFTLKSLTKKVLEGLRATRHRAVSNAPRSQREEGRELTTRDASGSPP